MIQPTLINLHPTEYTQGLRQYPFTVNLDKCIGSCHTPNDLSNKICVLNETEDLNLSIFNMLTGIKTFVIFGKNNIWNSATFSCENGKQLGNTIDDSVITCGEVRETTKAVSTNFNEKKSKLQNKKNLYFTCFLSITIALLIAVRICCYLIKYKAKRNNLLSYYVTNNKLNKGFFVINVL